MESVPRPFGTGWVGSGIESGPGQTAPKKQGCSEEIAMHALRPITGLFLSLAFLVPALARADIIHLKNGSKLEGDVEVRGNRYLLKTGDGMQVEIPMSQVSSVDIGKSTAKESTGGTVEREARKEEAREEEASDEELVRHRGRWIPASEKRALEEKEDLDKESRRIRKLIRKISSKAPGVAEDARARLLAYGAEEKRAQLIYALEDADKEVRIYAAQELGRIGDETEVAPLAQLAVEDRYRTVRVAAVQALRAIDAPDTSLHFVKALSASSPYQRVHAIEGLRAFPDRRSVRSLIETWHGISGGFGQGYFQDTTITTYITDYELASGGTGFVAVEIADPVVGQIQTGTILDVKVEYVEIVARIQTLSYLTGARPGRERKDWAAWYNENKDTFELAVGRDGKAAGDGDG